MLNLFQNQKYIPYTSSQTKTQSAVCILCRGTFIPTQETIQLDLNNPKNAKFLSQENIEILFIQRQHSSRDQYSGEIAFPGGKCESNETDLQAAIREVEEEIGINLKHFKTYFIGRLSKNTYMKKTRQNTSLYCTAFVIAINDPNHLSDNLNLSTDEVNDAKWIPLNYFDNPKFATKISKHYFGPKSISQFFQQAETAALDIGFNEVLYGFTFYLTVSFLCSIAKHTKVWNHAHYAKFTFTGPMKYALELGAMIAFKKERISLFDPWKIPIYLYLIPLLILIVIL